MNGSLQDYFTISRFEAADLDPARFDHEAHLYMAWLYLQEYPRDKAITSFDRALRGLTEKIGAERMIPSENWVAFRARNTDLFDDRPRTQAA